MTKSALRISAAMALAIVATSPLLAAKLRLPPPRAPEQKIYSPQAVAGELHKRGYRIESMKQQGTAYSIKATGPSKNRVQLMVDGRSGEIVGLAVLEAAASMVAAIAQAMKSGKNARYVDDWHPFGIIVPEIYQARWTPITSWTVGNALFIDAAITGRGYRYAVPYQTIRPGRGGRSRSTIRPSRMQKPLYDVYDSSGTELEMVSHSEDTTIISEVTTEETLYSAEETTLEESYLGGELAGESFEEASDFDAEDGDFEFADNAGDDYDAEVDETDFAASNEGDDADDADDADADDTDDDGADYESDVDEDDGGVADDAADADDTGDADDGGDDEDYSDDDGGDDDSDDYGDDDSGDDGDDDYDDDERSTTS